MQAQLDDTGLPTAPNEGRVLDWLKGNVELNETEDREVQAWLQPRIAAMRAYYHECPQDAMERNALRGVTWDGGPVNPDLGHGLRHDIELLYDRGWSTLAMAQRLHVTRQKIKWHVNRIQASRR